MRADAQLPNARYGTLGFKRSYCLKRKKFDQIVDIVMRSS